MMKKRLSKTLWYGTDVDSFGSPIIPPFTADPHDLDGLHVGELFLHYSDGMATLWTANESGNVVRISGGEGGVDLSQYLLISEFNKIWEIRTDSQGTEYIFGKLPVVTQYGITMYSGGSVDVPTIAEGLPYDNRTIWFNPETGLIEVIGGIGGGTGGGNGEGVSNFWELSGIPSWITNTKPTYSYSEIQGTPDLSKYALVSQIPSLNGYATESWVLGKGYATVSDLDGRINALINGAPQAYDTLKEIADVLQGNVNSIGDIITTLGNKADKATTLGGYGITDAYTKTNVDNLLKSYVTLAGTNKITTLGTITTGTWNGTKITNDYLANNKVSISGVDVSLGGSITQSALRTALGLGSNAYTSTAFLPLTGGTLTDYTETPLILKGTFSENVLLHLHNKSNIATSIGKYGTYTFLANYANGNGTGELEIHDDGRLTYATGGSNYSIWHEGNFNPSNYLPLSGGILENANGSPLRINSTHQGGSAIVFLHNSEDKAWLGYDKNVGRTYMYNTASQSYLGVRDNGTPYFNSYTLWHSGNFNPSNYLPLSGGILTNSGYQVLSITRATTANDYGIALNFSNSNGTACDLVAHVNTHYFKRGYDGNSYTIWDSGNDGSESGLDADLLDGKHLSDILASNVASATKLQTARTIWGQSFDGTGNVSGHLQMKNNTAIQFANANGDYYSSLAMSTENKLNIGYGTSGAGYDTNLYGNNISIRYGTSRTIGMFLNSSGNITIGSSDLASTSAKLYVNGKLALPNNRAVVNISSDGVGLDALHTTANNNLNLGYGHAQNGYNTYLNGKTIYFRYSASLATGMVLNSNGNLTVGASDLASTNYKLYVDGLTKITSSTNIGLQIDSSYKGEVTRGVQVLNPSMTFGDSNGVVLLFGQSTSAYNCGNIAYRHHGENSTANYVSLGLYGKDNILVCKANGNVGIGTTSPRTKLHVEGDIISTNFLRINTNNSTYDRLRLVASSNGYSYIQASNADGTSTEGGSLYVTGINTANLASFEVMAITSKFHGNILSTGGITMYSARKLKNIVDERGLSLEELSVIKPTRYTWKDGRDSKIHIGGIADDVMKVLPEVIYKTDNDTLTMDYGNAAFAIAASLIKPVISHEEEIKALKKRIKELEEQVKTLSWNIA